MDVMRALSAQSMCLSFTSVDQIAMGKKYSAGRHAAIPRWVSRAHLKVERGYTKV